MRMLLLGGFAAASLVGAAQAATSEGAMLVLKAPPAKAEVIQDGAMWRCTGTVCKAPAVKAMPAGRSCRKIVAELGAVSAFTWRGEALDAAGIDDCNTAAKP
ncbi:CC_3452 family protein [Caulobacter hibisci]|uniref:Uncharacterized protein n=1 Tax=Caulobacter hibisci TaxID=2035993 RepID=A0ABS0SVL0_9CAUL|nr:hypothetical protein [Caulobacter hibisci]MBI1683675.1 hypothetical protein [Caulobacter hibisci]